MMGNISPGQCWTILAIAAFMIVGAFTITVCAAALAWMLKP
jgi:hypothetical protein